MLHSQLIQETGGSAGVRDEKLLKNHAMMDGNKRIGTHAMLVLSEKMKYNLLYWLVIPNSNYIFLN
jgi:hypothetical protein